MENNFRKIITQTVCTLIFCMVATNGNVIRCDVLTGLEYHQNTECFRICSKTNCLQCDVATQTCKKCQPPGDVCEVPPQTTTTNMFTTNKEETLNQGGINSSVSAAGSNQSADLNDTTVPHTNFGLRNTSGSSAPTIMNSNAKEFINKSEDNDDSVLRITSVTQKQLGNVTFGEEVTSSVSAYEVGFTKQMHDDRKKNQTIAGSNTMAPTLESTVTHRNRTTTVSNTMIPTFESTVTHRNHTTTVSNTMTPTLESVATHTITEESREMTTANVISTTILSDVTILSGRATYLIYVIVIACILVAIMVIACIVRNAYKKKKQARIYRVRPKNQNPNNVTWPQVTHL